MNRKKVSVFLVTLVSVIFLIAGVASAGEMYKYYLGVSSVYVPGYSNVTAPMEYPTYVAVDVNGNVYTTDYPETKKITQIGQLKVAPEGLNGGLNPVDAWDAYGTWGSSFAQGLVVDNQGAVYMLDANYDNYTYNKVVKFQDGKKSFLWLGNFIKTPEGMAVDKDGNIYVLDGGDDENYGRVIKFNTDGIPCLQVGADYLEYPTAMTLDSLGNIYVVDVTEIVKYDPAGKQLAVFQEPIAGAYADTESLVVDAAGYIYVGSNDYILKLNPNGTLKCKWGSHGTASGQFDTLVGIAVDKDGNVYAADAGNNRVQVFVPFNDTTNPTGSVGITVGGLTKSRNITLKLNATDTFSGVGYMMISNSPTFTGAAWVPYSPYKAWTLPLGDGIKNIYVKYKDNSGNVSVIYGARTVLDTKVPTGRLLINNGTLYTRSIFATLNISAADISGVAKMIISNSPYFTGATWIPYTTAKAWNLTPGIGTKKVYIRFMDKAGNVSPVYYDTIVRK